MWEKINNFLKGQIVTSIIYVALGACLAFMPVNTINVICKFVFGILLILVGMLSYPDLYSGKTEFHDPGSFFWWCSSWLSESSSS